MQPRKNRREFPRIAASFDVFCLLDDLGERSARAYNLSAGGLALETNQPISYDERLAMVFQLPNTSKVIHTTGKVAWHQPRGDTFQHGSPLCIAGVEFQNLEESFKAIIANYTEGGGRVMKQRDKKHTLEADFEVDFSDEEGYSVRRNNKGNRFAGKLPGKSLFSFLLGALTVGVVLLVAGAFLRSHNVDSEIKLRSLENKIKQLEDRDYGIDQIKARLEEIEEKNKQFITFMDTFTKSETSPKTGITQHSEKQTKALYHEVVAGDTLYSISRRYRLTVEELLRLNHLKPGEVIHPKQRLLVRPASNQ